MSREQSRRYGTWRPAAFEREPTSYRANGAR